MCSSLGVTLAVTANVTKILDSLWTLSINVTLALPASRVFIGV